MRLPHVKICGITQRNIAQFCATAGAGAVGAIFYEKSPRCVTPAQARELFAGLPADLARVGVFVNVPAARMITMAREAALDTVQMHGNESAADILAVQQAGFHVVKALRHTGDELIAAANALPPRTGILVECSAGPMPGGTGNTWDWATAAALAPHHPFALAGGLTAANLPEAVRASQAAGLDASSSLETAPGIKNPDAIRAFLEAAAALPPPPASFVWKGNS